MNDNTGFHSSHVDPPAENSFQWHANTMASWPALLAVFGFPPTDDTSVTAVPSSGWLIETVPCTAVSSTKVHSCRSSHVVLADMSLAQFPTPCCILVAAVLVSDFLAKMHVVMVPSPLKLSPYGPCQRQCYNQEGAGATSGKRLKISSMSLKKQLAPEIVLEFLKTQRFF